MKKKVLVLGSLGMLGHEVFSEMKTLSDLEIIGTYNSKEPSDKNSFLKLDVKNPTGSLNTILEGADYVINCIATLISDIDEDNEESTQNAVQVNSFFPKILSELSAPLNSKVIHISTDGVFSGNSESPLHENIKPSPNDIYGKSKLQGEIKSPNVINIRTSVIGRDPNYKRGLLEWFLKQEKGAEISGYTDIWHGVTNKQLAILIKQIISKNFFDEIRAESHVHHFCPNPPLSKFDLLAIFKEMFNKDIKINKVERPGGALNRTLSTSFKKIQAFYEGKKDIKSAIMDIK
jgi:dTDP-4-dehydrorhamnose reductase